MTWVIESLSASYFTPRRVHFLRRATFACVSKYLPAKRFNSMKPHRYGWKVLMTYCAVTGFCYKFELCQGAGVASGNVSDKSLEDMKSGPRALFRSTTEFHGTQRVVICDRFYTSLIIFYQVVQKGIFAIGRILPNRNGSLCLVA